MQARQTRVERQNKLAKLGEGLICFTMNIAGPYKNSPLIKKAFEEGVSRVRQLLLWHDIATLNYEEYIEKTGCEGYFATTCEPYKLKKLMVQIEDSFMLGRLYDIDILKQDGEKISRTEVGESQRKCLICGSEGAGCARSRAHTVEQLQEKTIGTICHFFNSEYVKGVSENAVKALLYEVSVTPKPGLVDRKDNGAHRDMDFFTFIDSSCSLLGYFESCATKGVEMSALSPERLFCQLRYIGRLAQEKMYKATRGINTHKGAIFSLGIICAAIGYLYANGRQITLDSILSLCSQMATQAIGDFEEIKSPKTFGEKLYCQLKLTGIRGQAADGFPSVKNIAYPVLCQCLKEGKSFNDAGAVVLLHLLTQVDDTNIIKRSSVETLRTIQSQIKKKLSDDKVDLQQILTELNDEFIKQNISPGGCADLLSMAYMLYFTL